MLTLPPTVRVFIGLDPIDMRRSFDGLAAQVSARLTRDPLDGHLYCFVNRARTMMKVLFSIGRHAAKRLLHPVQEAFIFNTLPN